VETRLCERSIARICQTDGAKLGALTKFETCKWEVISRSKKGGVLYPILGNLGKQGDEVSVLEKGQEDRIAVGELLALSAAWFPEDGGAMCWNMLSLEVRYCGGTEDFRV